MFLIWGVLGLMGAISVCPALVVLVTNSWIVVCLVVFGLVAPTGGGVTVGATYVGSASSSPRSRVTLALQRWFLRFLGRLKPQTNLRLCKLSVVWLRPSIGQLFLVRSGMNWSCGW